MTSTRKILGAIESAQAHTDALVSLAAGMAAGLKEGTVDGDHMYTLLVAVARSIRSDLDTVAAAAVSIDE